MNAIERRASFIEHETGGSRLWSWVCFSAGLHVLIIGSAFIVPPSTARRPTAYPVYTVDLVGGAGPQEPLAHMPAARLDPPAQPEQTETPAAVQPKSEEVAAIEEETKKPATEVASPEPAEPKPDPVAAKEPDRPKETKEAPEPPPEPAKLAKPEVAPVAVTKAEETPQEKPKPKVAQKEVQKPPKTSEKKVAKKTTRKPSKRVKQARNSAVRKKRTKTSNLDRIAKERLREKRIEAAVAKVRDRAGTQRRSAVVAGNDSPWQDARAGTGRGIGAGVGDGVGDGGGDVRSLEFVIYRNRMLDQIKSMWTWVGKRTDLEVTVRFGVDSTGGVFALQIVGTSGDASYDESVIRAVTRASPLPPPPASYLRDFSDVELTFRPRDLSG